MKHNFNLQVEARNHQEAEAKMAALATLGSSLSAKELEKLAHVVANDPVKTALAKKYLGL